MKKLFSVIFAMAVAVAVAVAALSPSEGKSEVKSYTTGGYITYTYSDASLLSAVPNTTEGGYTCSSMQGMAIGSTYGYVAKHKDEIYCDVTRITMSTGATSVMSYYASLDATSTSTCSGVFGHANELEVVENTSTGTWLFSVSLNSSKAVTRLKISGTKMYLAGYYNLQLSDGTRVSASALKYVKTVNGNMYFLFKRARNFYTAIIPVENNSGTASNPTVITLYKLFTQDLRNAVFATSNSAYSVEDGLDSWTNQGFGYNATQKVLYVPEWDESGDPSDNAIVTYNLADLMVDSYWTDCTNKNYVVYPTKTSFRICQTSQNLFEIESCSFITGTTNNLYFNTNATTVASYEGVFKIPMSKADFTPVNDGKAAYTIKYNANGGSGSMSNTYHVNGIGTKIRANTYTLAGSTFGGWYPYRKSDGKWLYTLENGSTKWYLKGEQPTGAHLTLRADESRVSAVCSVDGDVATYYAQWIPNSTGTKTYYIRYDANGGSGSMAETAVIYGTSTPLRTNTYTRSGYTFLGWNAFRHNQSQWVYKSTSSFSDTWLDASADKAGYILKTYKDGAAVAKTTSVDTDIVELYAAWGRVSGGTVPQRLTQGKDFTVGGIIESTTDLYGVKVNIKNSDGDIIQTYSTTTYGSRTTSGNGIDLSNANATLDFSTLGKGSYTYEVVVQVIEGSSPRSVTLLSSPFVVGESASTPVADLLDVVFNADGTATDVSSSDMNVTTYANAATLSTAYSDKFGRHTATFAPATANSTISSGFYEISYAGNTEWQSKLEDGFTMECVVKYTVEPSGSSFKFFGAQQTGGVALYNSTDNLFRFSPYVGGSYRHAISTVTPEKDKYYHLVGVYDKTLGQVRMYIDGKPVATVTDVTGDYTHPASDVSQRFVLGGDPNSTSGKAENAAPCEIVIARIYDAELSDADVDYLYGLQSSALDDSGTSDNTGSDIIFNDNISEMTEVWNYSDKKGNTASASWLDLANYSHDLAIDGDNLYVLNCKPWGTATINIVDPFTGASKGTVDVSCQTSSARIKIGSIEMLGDQLIGVSAITAHTLVFYKLNSAKTALEEWATATPGVAMGDQIITTGDMTSGAIWLVSTPTSTVYKYTVTNGIVNTTPSTITLGKTIGSHNGSAGITFDKDGTMWVDGKDVVPMHFKADGTYIESLPTAALTTNGKYATAVNLITFGSKTYMAAMDYVDTANTLSGGAFSLINMTDGIDAITAPIGTYPSAGLGSTTRNTNHLSDLTHALTNDGKQLYVWVAVAGQGVACYTFDGRSSTNIEDISIDDNKNVPVEWYNLQGIRVDGENLKSGIYIRRQGREVKKILVK